MHPYFRKESKRLNEETVMETELFIPAIFIILAVLLMGLLPIFLKELESERQKQRDTSREGRLSWLESCYEPCVKDPDESSDSCVLKCNRAFL
jgi:hypothetical protein